MNGKQRSEMKRNPVQTTQLPLELRYSLFRKHSDGARAEWGGDDSRYNSLIKSLTFLLVTEIELMRPKCDLMKRSMEVREFALSQVLLRRSFITSKAQVLVVSSVAKYPTSVFYH